MKKSESNFLKELEGRVQAQRNLVGTEILPSWATSLGEWLVVNPWRVLVPLSGAIYILMRLLMGVRFRELILAIFGGY